MKDFVIINFKYILIFLSILIGSYFIYSIINNFTENRIEGRIKEEKNKIESLKRDVVYWKTKSEMFENESKNYKLIVEKSKQNITTIINKYDEKRVSVRDLDIDESIKFLSKRLNQKNNSK